MARIILLTLTWFGFGVIAAEIFNSFEWFDYRVNVLFIAIPITLFSVISDIVLNTYKKKAKNSAGDERRYHAVLKRYRFLLGSIGISIFVLIPLVWWGVIKQLAALAGDGYRDF